MVIENTYRLSLSELDKFKYLGGQDIQDITDCINSKFDFPELDAFKTALPQVQHIQVNEVSSDTINRVFYAILSTSKLHRREKLIPKTQDEMMRRIPGSDTFYFNKEDQILLDIGIKPEAYPRPPEGGEGEVQERKRCEIF